MVTVVTIKMTAGAVSKIPSQSSQPSHSPRIPRPHRTVRRPGDGQPGSGPLPGCGRQRCSTGCAETMAPMPQEPHSSFPPEGWISPIAGKMSRSDKRGAGPAGPHGTLQPQDESVIVGYYTSEEVFPRNLRFQKSKFRRYFAYGKRRRY